MGTGANTKAKPKERVLVRNRRAAHEYHLETQVEAGIALLGSEVKSLREGQATLQDAFVDVREGELWLVDAQISPYPWANQFGHEPRRKRKLLLHKHEIRRLSAKVREKGYTLIPTEIYLKGGRIKITVALARGKRQYEKREAQRAKEARKEMERS